MHQRLKLLVDQAMFHGDRYALPDELAEQLTKSIVEECTRILYLNGYDDAVECLSKELADE
jgi:hypothetical protein